MSHLSQEDLQKIRLKDGPITPQMRMNLAKDIADNIFPKPGKVATSQHEVDEWLERLGIEALWTQPEDTILMCCIWRYLDGPWSTYLDRFIIAFVGYDSVTIEIFNLGEEAVYDG